MRMIYAFDGHEIDTAVFEVRRKGRPLSAEPLVFNLLRHLVENRDRVVSKDELIEVVWSGRFISDAALSTAVKSARRLVGDDGRAQNVIRTAHGRGFRFVAEVAPRTPAQAIEAAADDEASPDAAPSSPPPGSAPTVVVAPFTLDAPMDDCPVLPAALAHDVIQALSRLRWLRVVPRGSAFRLAGAEDPLGAAATRLNADYVLFGSMSPSGRGFDLRLELVIVSERRCLLYTSPSPRD